MKKLFIFAMALGLAACTTDKSGNNGTENGDADVNYLSINIISADGGLTRTQGDYDDENGYEDGKPFESKVSRIRFYFFDEGGNAVTVTASGNLNYRDWGDGTETSGNVKIEDEQGPDYDGSINIEHIIKATVTLEKPTGTTKLPAEVIAIINPDQAIMNLKKINRNELLSATEGAVGAYFGHTEGNFVMSNSVYASGTTTTGASRNPQKHCASSLDGHLFSTMDAARANPVTIYVERLMAKVDLSYGAATTGGSETLTATQLGDNSWGFDTGKTYDGIDGDDKKIYVRFEGYNVTATADKEYLIKQINKDWPNSYNNAQNLFQTLNEPWNYSEFFRSFWAINPSDVDYNYGIYSKDEPEEDDLFPGGQYENVNPALKYKFNIKENGTSGENIAYLPENAGKAAGTAPTFAAAATETPSQVIIAATLVDKTGKPLDLAEYVTYKTLQTNLAETMLSALNPRFAYKSADNTYTEIGKGDVEFKTAWQLAGEDKMPEEGRYYVYLKLQNSPAITNRTWYNGIPTEDIKNNPGLLADWEAEHLMKTADGKTVVDQINQALKNLGPAKIWNGGKTYYFFDIRHLASPVIEGKNPGDEEYDVESAAGVPGYYGVVRNHVYKTRITSLVGLGTPVYDPNEIIIPEKPGDEKVYLAAEIRILSWRIVNSDVTLDW